VRKALGFRKVGKEHVDERLGSAGPFGAAARAKPNARMPMQREGLPVWEDSQGATLK
jgi:hypothetical protein